MTKLSKRLRDAFAVYQDSLGKRLIDEAADTIDEQNAEIERLRSIIEAAVRNTGLAVGRKFPA